MFLEKVLAQGSIRFRTLLRVMQRFEVGDRVRIDIPDEDDPDFDRLHDHFGTVIGVWRDDADDATGDERDRYLYQVELMDGGTASLRWRDLRPVASE